MGGKRVLLLNLYVTGGDKPQASTCVRNQNRIRQQADIFDNTAESASIWRSTIRFSSFWVTWPTLELVHKQWWCREGLFCFFSTPVVCSFSDNQFVLIHFSWLLDPNHLNTSCDLKQDLSASACFTVSSKINRLYLRRERIVSCLQYVI